MFWKRKIAQASENFSGNTKPLLFNSVDFRDGQQSALATRLKTEDMLPLLERMDNIGFSSMEMWGGATFDVCIRYLQEDPWERLCAFKSVVKKTPLKMVLRGQNLVGYRAYPDDIVETFVKKAAQNGIDIFLIFDALADLRNCEVAFHAAKRAGKKVEGSLQYNISPLNTIQEFVSNAKAQQDMGADVMHIEDMAGLMTPEIAFKLVAELKNALKIPVHLHCHCTGGMAEMAYYEAIRAGADGVDVCISPLSKGSSLPPIESLIASLSGTKRDPKINLSQFDSLNNDLLALRKKYNEFSTELIGVDVGCLQHQIPGGMLSNLERQLKEMKQYDKLPLVLNEMIQVRADMGYPPLATPSSQICGAQATFNIITGSRYSMLCKEMKDYCKGLYGKPPGEISQELMEKALPKQAPEFKRPGEMLEPGMDNARNASAAFARSEEDILTYALFPQIAEEFLKKKYNV